jgi:hypothetical protein
MYEGIFAMALRCTPCKTEKERVYSKRRVENIFTKAGIKLGGFCFALRCFSSQQAKSRTYWEQLRAGPAAQGEFCFARLAARLKVVP